MSLIADLPLTVLVLGAIPLAWSGLVFALHAGAAALARPGVGSMRLEAMALALMIAPAFAGAALLLASPALPAAPIPAFELAGPAWEPLVAAVEPANGAFVAPAVRSRSPWPVLSSAIAAFYLAGLAICVLRLVRVRLRLGRMVAASKPAPALGEDVRLSDDARSPFASPCGAIVLPRRLAETLPAANLALIVRHERAHVERGDARAYWALACVDALFWFNPFVRRQTARCRLAAELACDAAVVADAPDGRAAYAGALVAAAKHVITGPSWAPSIFATRRKGEHRLRLARIMSDAPAPRSPLARASIAAATLLVVPLGALQLAACATGAPAPEAPPTATGTPAAPNTAAFIPNRQDYVITVADGAPVTVERADDHITLEGPLTLSTGDTLTTFERVELDLAPSDADGGTAFSVMRITSPRAVYAAPGEPMEVLQAVFMPGCGTLTLPELGLLPTGDCASASAPRAYDDGDITSITPLRLSVLPVGGRISSAFGPRIDPFNGSEARHAGVDIVAPRYTPIVAPIAGRVTFAGWRGGYGRVVELDHGGNVKSRYGNLQQPSVSAGDEVAAGQEIGLVGCTGRCTGDHLHWEIWHAGLVYDPEPMMAELAAR